MRERFESIQYLRGLAALAVVFYHARHSDPWLYPALDQVEVGKAGVDVFFVVSGFIMYVAAKDDPVGLFAYRRFLRIVPLYWLATALFALLPLYRHVLELRHLLLSLLFVPHYSPTSPAEIWPVLIQGWTLNYEIFFYLMFAAGLASRRLSAVVIGVMPLLVILGLLFLGRNAVWLTYTNPLLLEFLAGFLIAKYRERLTAPLACLLLPLGLAALLSSYGQPFSRALVWGPPAAALVVGALAIERAGLLPRWHSLKMMGDASYSIYLFHVIPVTLARKAVQHLPVTGALQLVLVIVASLAAAIFAGLAVYYAVERPILRRFAPVSKARLEALAAP